MKPLRLEMQAFGPFARRQIIDFRRLGDGSFFLIHGPTGSGKTTILDGLCFALFGDSSGGERDGRQMRSQHAPPELLTEVRFEFALGAERYRVERVPEQIRPARRGGGDTRQAPKAALWRLSGEGEVEQARPLATKWGEVGARVAELLGFESRQFRQVIVLPQGRFRDFLVSRSQDRERILQSLFGTEFYKRIEDALKQAANELEREAGELRTRRQALLDNSRTAIRIIYGAATLFVMAAFVEAFWSSLASLPATVKYAVGIGLWVLVTAYFRLAGQEQA